MGYPERRFLGLTWVGWLNFLLLQWFGVRLGGRFEKSRYPAPVVFAGWFVRVPVLPLSGWWASYIPRRAWMLPRLSRTREP